MYVVSGPYLFEGAFPKIISQILTKLLYNLSSFTGYFILTLATIDCGFKFKQCASLQSIGQLFLEF